MKKSYYPMQTLTAALLTMKKDRIAQAAEELIVDDRYDEAACFAIEDAIALGWNGFGLDELLESRAAGYFEVLALLARNSLRLGITSDQALRMLENCRERGPRHYERRWDPRAITALYELALNTPYPARIQCREAHDACWKERESHNVVQAENPLTR